MPVRLACTACVPQGERAMGSLIVSTNIALVIYYIAIVMLSLLRPRGRALRVRRKLASLRRHISAGFTSALGALKIPVRGASASANAGAGMGGA